MLFGDACWLSAFGCWYVGGFGVHPLTAGTIVKLIEHSCQLLKGMYCIVIVIRIVGDCVLNGVCCILKNGALTDCRILWWFVDEFNGI